VAGGCGVRVAGGSTRGDGLAFVTGAGEADAGGAESTGTVAEALGGGDGGVTVSCAGAGEAGGGAVRTVGFITMYPAIASASRTGTAQRKTGRFAPGAGGAGGAAGGVAGCAGACTSVAGSSAGRSATLGSEASAGETCGVCFGRSRVFGTGLAGVRAMSPS
jgi:hypothetical protein